MSLLLLFTGAGTSPPDQPYQSHVTTDAIVASWNVSPLPFQPRQKQIIDGSSIPRSQYTQSFFADQWRSDVPVAHVRKAFPPAADQPRPARTEAIVASWYFTFTLPPAAPKLPLDSPPIPRQKPVHDIIAGAWAPFVLPQLGTKKAPTLDDAPQPNGRAFQTNLVPTLWNVAFFDSRTNKSIAVFTPNIPPEVIPGTPAGGYLPNIDVQRLGWGAIRAYPQVVFDVAMETQPRGLPVAAVPPVMPVMVTEDEKQKLARYAEAAAAFDLDLVMKYLAAVGIDLNG